MAFFSSSPLVTYLLENGVFTMYHFLWGTVIPLIGYEIFFLARALTHRNKCKYYHENMIVIIVRKLAYIWENGRKCTYQPSST